MTDKQFQKLLTKCADTAKLHNELCKEVGAECKRRYGKGYNEVDADSIIDVLDYYGGTITVAEVEEEMTMRTEQVGEGNKEYSED